MSPHSLHVSTYALRYVLLSLSPPLLSPSFLLVSPPLCFFLLSSPHPALIPSGPHNTASARLISSTQSEWIREKQRRSDGKTTSASPTSISITGRGREREGKRGRRRRGERAEQCEKEVFS